MSIRNPTYHKIRTDGNVSEIERILTILFVNGYVFGNLYRLKNLVLLKQKHCIADWEYIRHGHDHDCKYVIGCLRRGENTIQNYKIITVEEFLQIKITEERREKEAEERIKNFNELSDVEKNFAYNAFNENHTWDEVIGWQKKESISNVTTIMPTLINMNTHNYETMQSMWGHEVFEVSRRVQQQIDQQIIYEILPTNTLTPNEYQATTLTERESYHNNLLRARDRRRIRRRLENQHTLPFQRILTPHIGEGSTTG